MRLRVPAFVCGYVHAGMPARACVYMCVCACVWACRRACASCCVYARASACTCACACVHVCMCACVHGCMSVCREVFVCVHACVCLVVLWRQLVSGIYIYVPGPASPPRERWSWWWLLLPLRLWYGGPPWASSVPVVAGPLCGHVGRGAAVGRAVGRSVGRSLARSVGRSVGRPVGRSIGRSVGLWVGRSIGWSVARPVGWSVVRSVGRSIGRSVGMSVGRSADPVGRSAPFGRFAFLPPVLWSCPLGLSVILEGFSPSDWSWGVGGSGASIPLCGMEILLGPRCRPPYPGG